MLEERGDKWTLDGSSGMTAPEEGGGQRAFSGTYNFVHLMLQLLKKDEAGEEGGKLMSYYFLREEVPAALVSICLRKTRTSTVRVIVRIK